MAASPFEPSLPGSSFFEIFPDGIPPTPRSNANLPAGACNFVDLTPGANGAKCGCRRFWGRPPVPGRTIADALNPEQAVWCMCAHHACFHDDGRGGGVVATVAGQENERPKANREPLTPVLDVSMPTPGLPAVDLPALSVASFSTRRPEETADMSEGPSQQHDTFLPDTLSWRDFINSQPGQTTLPAIPSQCMMASQAPSETSSARARYLRPFAGKGLRTLSGASASKARSPLQEKAVEIAAAVAPGSPVAPDIQKDKATEPYQPDEGSTCPNSQATVSQAVPSQNDLRHLSATVSGHEARLDRLETVSFTATGHEECSEKQDQMDLRLTDLEVRFEDFEKGMNDNSSFGTARGYNRRDADDTTASMVSGMTEAGRQRISTSELYSEVESLKAQFSQFRSSLPSIIHPWQLEVVFLPFPLRRLWQDIEEFKDPPSNADEWTQLPSTFSSATLRAQSPFHADWAGPDRQDEWLLPRACALNSITDKRLRSRGLIQTLSVTGSDARSIQQAMNQAFGSLLQDMSVAAVSSPRRRSMDVRVARFLGLQQPWIPLRKVHKDSRLRFLTPEEMITPALWNKTFLDSVIMKSSSPRLFVTQPEAYLQDPIAMEWGWTWQKIRELSRVYPDSHDSQEVPEGDAMEEYWAFNENLDDSPVSISAGSSNANHARQRVSMSPSQQFYTGLESMQSSSPVLIRGQTPIQERRTSMTRPLHIRTTSMPPTILGHPSPAQSRRRVVSSGQRRSSRAGTPQARSSMGMMSAIKRRRTRSPSHPRNTPRWTASPSPMPQGAAADGRARNTTPFYYATPYSNAPLAETRPSRLSGGAADDDEEDEYAQRDPDHGSTTDPYSDGESATGDGGDLHIVNHTHAAVHPHHARQQQAGHDSQPWQLLPEDEPWRGIEDQDRMSDGENIDPQYSTGGAAEGEALSDDDDGSEPSQYPTNEQAWHVAGAEGGAGFPIHEDDEMRNLQWA